MPVDITRLLGNFDPLSTFDKARTGAEQRSARQFIGNNPRLSADDKISRLLSTGLTPEANAVANLENSRANADFRKRSLAQGQKNLDRTFQAGRDDAAFRRTIAEATFLQNLNDRAQDQQSRQRARAGLETVLQREIPDASPEEIAAIADSGQAAELLKTRRRQSAPPSQAEQARIQLQQAEFDRKKQKDELARQEKEQVIKARAGEAINTAKVGGRAIDDALKILEEESFVTGIGGGIAGLIPGTDRQALEGALKTIRGKVAFKALTDLKAQGGTLGALSGTELALLEASEGNLDPSLPKETLVRNLKQLRKIYEKIDPSIGATGQTAKSQLRVGQSQNLGNGVTITKTAD